MKNIVLLLLGLSLFSCTEKRQVSPNGKLELVYTQADGSGHEFKIWYTDSNQRTEALDISAIGVQMADGVGKGLVLKDVISGVKREGSYEMHAGKERCIHYEANEYTYVFGDSLENEVRMVFRLYEDGVAFRYEIPHLKETRIEDELTTYHIPEGRKRWMQSFDMSYERFFPESTTGKERHNHWGYPALIQMGDHVWTLISEVGIEKMHCASSLKNEKEVSDFKVTLGNHDNMLSGDWFSPWRVAMIGTLSDVVESTLVTDVSPENRIGDISWIQPGAVSWIYWAYNHGSKDYQIVKKYIDMAVELSLPYVLIDAEWDEMSNGGSIEDAILYAKERHVKPLIWYNSSTAWLKEWGAPGPHHRLNDPDKREKEFQWLEDRGVAGVKIDFFAGDHQETMNYCIDLLECAMRHRLLVNFHGATIPRGWQRTYPNLLTVEGVYGAEWYNNAPILTNRAAAHNATLPFTRNVIGPMDYTPCTFSDSQHPHITSHAHELALTVVFESALQHLADRPESYLAQPQEVRDFLSTLPTTWDITKLLSGYPGQSVVMARCKNKVWYVGGLNGTEDDMPLDLDWSFLDEGIHEMTLFQDSKGEKASWRIETIKGTKNELITHLELQPRGGFVAVIK